MIKYPTINDGMSAFTKIRYKSTPSNSVLHAEAGRVRVDFDTPVKGIAPGQSAVFYEGDDVIGGGIILRGEEVL
jgi:tRNA-specific 2-thiouridylase